MSESPKVVARKLAQAAYAEHADEVATLLDNPNVNRFEHEVVWPRMEALLPATAQEVLDFGCGSGYFTNELSERFADAQVTGTDVSEQMMMHARSTSAAVHWGVWNGITKPAEAWQEKFDLVVCKMAFPRGCSSGLVARAKL